MEKSRETAQKIKHKITLWSSYSNLSIHPKNQKFEKIYVPLSPSQHYFQQPNMETT